MLRRHLLAKFLANAEWTISKWTFVQSAVYLSVVIEETGWISGAKGKAGTDRWRLETEIWGTQCIQTAWFSTWVPFFSLSPILVLSAYGCFIQSQNRWARSQLCNAICPERQKLFLCLKSDVSTNKLDHLACSMSLTKVFLTWDFVNYRWFLSGHTSWDIIKTFMT